MTIDCDTTVGKVILFVMEWFSTSDNSLGYSTYRVFKQLNDAQLAQYAFLAMIEEIKPTASAPMTTIS